MVLHQRGFSTFRKTISLQTKTYIIDGKKSKTGKTKSKIGTNYEQEEKKNR